MAIERSGKRQHKGVLVRTLALTVSALMAFLQWVFLFESPVSLNRWVAVALAVVVPLGVTSYLGWKSSFWGILAFFWASLAAVVGLTMTMWLPIELVSRCRPSHYLLVPGARQDPSSWFGMMTWQLVAAALFFVIAARPGEGSGRVGLLKSFTVVLVVQMLAFVVVAETAFLGLPVPGALERTLGEAEVQPFFDDTISSWTDPEAHAESITFLYVHHLFLQAAAVSIHHGGDGDWWVTSLLTRRLIGEKGERVWTLRRRISASKARRLFDKLESIGLRDIQPGALGSGGFDGSSWVFKGHDRNQRIDLEAWSPTYRADHRREAWDALVKIERAGRLMLSHSGFAICQDWLI